MSMQVAQTGGTETSPGDERRRIVDTPASLIFYASILIWILILVNEENGAWYTSHHGVLKNVLFSAVSAPPW
jgi:hypothetical protein